MKKFFGFLTVMLLTSACFGADFFSASFINADSIRVTNAATAATYGGGITNLDVPALHLAGGTWYNRSNVFGTYWTNYSGSALTVTNTYEAGVNSSNNNYVNLLGAVPLWGKSNGDWWEVPKRTMGYWSVAAYPSNYVDEIDYTNASSTASLLIKLYTVNTAADSPVNFRFAGSPNGTDVPTSAWNIWTVGVDPAAVTGGTYMITTNVPLWKWPGCKKLYLLDICNTDETANSAVFVTECSINAWKP